MHRYLFVLLTLIFSNYSHSVSRSCESIELIDGQEKYNSLVCEGINNFHVGLYNEAVSKYLSALEIRFLELPNYRLNARIAHAYLLSGNLERADHFIKRSELTLSLLAGIYSCEVNENELFFISKDGQHPLISSVSTEIASEMCGGAYDYIYNNRFKTLSAVVIEGQLAEYHSMVMKLIKERNTLDKKDN